MERGARGGEEKEEATRTEGQCRSVNYEMEGNGKRRMVKITKESA